MKPFEIFTFGDPSADLLLLQMVDGHDLELMESEIAHIDRLSGGQPFCLQAVKVQSWNDDLSPWAAPPVFGSKGFGGKAEETLQALLDALDEGVFGAGSASNAKTHKIYLGGYSLAGLFALWAGCKADRFHGIAAASPSVWFPGFVAYLEGHPVPVERIYLSLGDKEERTRNPLMSRAADAIRDCERILTAAGKTCTLEWNPGNHFREPDLRMAKGFAWLMK